ncbi:MAG TPA: hypothetical protein ENF81_07540 [Thermotogaceae bacterium]|nr:hypothetical protein [Thermotogaceae bacterium]
MNCDNKYFQIKCDTIWDGNNQIVLLKCTSSYPAPIEEANLRTIPNLAETFRVVSGLSDHTEGIAVPIGAVALGAKVVEKHFTLDRSLGGPDAKFSLEPDEFAEMVKAVRNIEKALGRVTYELSEKQQKSREHAKSMFVSRNIKAGEFFAEDNIKVVRPGYGLHPKYYRKVIGKRAKRDIEKGEPLRIDLIDWGDNYEIRS